MRTRGAAQFCVPHAEAARVEDCDRAMRVCGLTSSGRGVPFSRPQACEAPASDKHRSVAIGTLDARRDWQVERRASGLV
jgi:hypothetical protein